MKHIVCDWLLGCAFAARSVAGVPDLEYAAVLFDQFQSDSLAALTHAQVMTNTSDLSAEDRLRFAVAAQIIALESDVAMAPLSDDELSIEQRLRLAMAQALASHRNQRWTALDHALTEFELLMPSVPDAAYAMQMEARFLRAEWAAAVGRFDLAQTMIDTLDAKDSRRAYALFNLGVSMNAAGASKRAVDVLAKLADMDVYSPEAMDLKQRGRLALALINLQQTKSASAERLLGEIPARSRYSAPALATYGSLAMKDGEHELAARVWTTLGQTQGWSSAGVTAQLALPLSLVPIATPAVALAQFRRAEAELIEHQNALRQLAAQSQDHLHMASLLRAMAHAFNGGADGLKPVLEDFQRALGHHEWTQWFADASAQRRLGDLLTADRMIDSLSQSQAELPALGFVAEERKRRTALLRKDIARTDLHDRTARLRDRLESQLIRLAEFQTKEPVAETAWMLEVADVPQALRVSELAALRMRADRLPDTNAKVATHARIDRLQAVLFFELAGDARDRLQAAQRAADRLGERIAALDVRTNRLIEQTDIAATSSSLDFDAADRRIDALLDRLVRSRQENEMKLVDVLRRRIDRQGDRIDRQIELTRIAIARAMDSAAGGEAPSG